MDKILSRLETVVYNGETGATKSFFVPRIWDGLVWIGENDVDLILQGNVLHLSRQTQRYAAL